MSPDEPLYQKGICPNCPTETQQQFLFATEECSGPVIELGILVAYEELEVFSLFRCVRCENILFYETMPETPTGIRFDELDYYAAEGVSRLTTEQFLDLSRLRYSTKNYKPKEKPILDPSTPEFVKRCYEIGTRVRPISNDLYALQLRKTLEAICKDLGAPELVASGKRTMLWQQIDELENKMSWDILFLKLRMNSRTLAIPEPTIRNKPLAREISANSNFYLVSLLTTFTARILKSDCWNNCCQYDGTLK